MIEKARTHTGKRLVAASKVVFMLFDRLVVEGV